VPLLARFDPPESIGQAAAPFVSILSFIKGPPEPRGD